MHFSEMIFERCYSSSEEAPLASGQPYCWAVAGVGFSSATKAYLASLFTEQTSIRRAKLLKTSFLLGCEADAVAIRIAPGPGKFAQRRHGEPLSSGRH